MTRAFHLFLFALLMFPASLGCSYKHLYGETLPGVDLQARHHIYVVQQTNDERGIDSMIASRLEQAGFLTTSGLEIGSVPSGVDTIVTYEDHWQWDMSMYLIVLRIDFRDPGTEVLLASGQSYRTSLDRRPAEFMINEIITALFPGR